MPFALLAAAILAAFGALLGAPLFGDDMRFIGAAPWASLPPGEFWVLLFSPRYFALTGEGSYQPLTTGFHYAAYAQPWFYRAAGLALHWGAASMLWLLARRLKLGARAALAAALLFALHPSHTETLAVSSFKGHLLAAFFTLAALLAWERLLDTGKGMRTVFVLLALALLSKETGLVALPLLGLYTLLFGRGRQAALQGEAAAWATALAAAYLAWRFHGLRGAELTPPVPSSPPAVLGWYAARLVWPLPLCREQLPPSSAWLAGAAAYAAALWAARSRPRALFGMSWAGISLLPFIAAAGRYADSPVADRYLYSAAAGLALALADLAEARRVLPALAAAGLLWLGAGAQRTLLMRSPSALYEQTTRCAAGHPKAWGVLSAQRLDEGRYEEARDCARRALSLAPDYPGAQRILERAEAELRRPAKR